tara:strand:- start:61 stop:189 length:129 start_codon:yes stop_codon:yes gene_type:complete
VQQIQPGAKAEPGQHLEKLQLLTKKLTTTNRSNYLLNLDQKF